MYASMNTLPFQITSKIRNVYSFILGDLFKHSVEGTFVKFYFTFMSRVLVVGVRR